MPLDWEYQFIVLMSKMSHDIALYRNGTLAKYQTVIAAGCYVGARPKVLLSLRWIDLLNVRESVLKQSKVFKNKKVLIQEDLMAIAKKNLAVVKPESLHFPILHNKEYHPITTASFNQQLKKLFTRYAIQTDNASSYTLRKTFALRLFQVLGETMAALLTVQKALGHQNPEYTLEYIGITWKKVKQGLELM